MEKHLQLFSDGKRFFEKKDYDRAEKCFVALLRTHRNFADVYNMLGVIYHINGQFSRAIECFESATKINPQYTEALLNLAVLYNDLGQYKKASALYKKVHPPEARKKREKVDPFIKNKLANKHAELGDIYEGIGLYPEAIREFEQALQLRPKFLDIRTKLAICLREEGRHREAIKIFTEVLKTNEKYSQARVQLGITHYALGEKTKAIKVWKEAVKLDPENGSAKMYLKLSEGMEQ